MTYNRYTNKRHTVKLKVKRAAANRCRGPIKIWLRAWEVPAHRRAEKASTGARAGRHVRAEVDLSADEHRGDPSGTSSPPRPRTQPYGSPRTSPTCTRTYAAVHRRARLFQVNDYSYTGSSNVPAPWNQPWNPSDPGSTPASVVPVEQVIDYVALRRASRGRGRLLDLFCGPSGAAMDTHAPGSTSFASTTTRSRTTRTGLCRPTRSRFHRGFWVASEASELRRDPCSPPCQASSTASHPPGVTPSPCSTPAGCPT